MKTIKSLLAIFCATFLFSVFCGNTLEGAAKPKLARGTIMVTVKKVTSGDHFTAVKDGSTDEIDCILWGVEAQKTPEAKEYLEKLIKGKKIQVEWKDPVFKLKRAEVRNDSSGKIPKYYLVQAKIKIDRQWTFVGAEVLRCGLGQCREDELKGALDGPYRVAQKYARENKIGMWAIPGIDGGESGGEAEANSEE